MLKVSEKGYLISDQDDPAVRKSCKDKRTFVTRKQAKDHRRKHPHDAAHIYRCETCNYFHLTNNHNDSFIDGQVDWRGFRGPDSIKFREIKKARKKA